MIWRHIYDFLACIRFGTWNNTLGRWPCSNMADIICSCSYSPSNTRNNIICRCLSSPLCNSMVDTLRIYGRSPNNNHINTWYSSRRNLPCDSVVGSLHNYSTRPNNSHNCIVCKPRICSFCNSSKACTNHYCSCCILIDILCNFLKNPLSCSMVGS